MVCALGGLRAESDGLGGTYQVVEVIARVTVVIAGVGRPGSRATRTRRISGGAPSTCSRRTPGGSTGESREGTVVTPKPPATS